jgi:DnaJ family protein A protein 2
VQCAAECPACGGERLQLETKALVVVVEPGADTGYKVVCRGEANQHPGWEPADVVLVVVELGSRPLFTSTFTRRGNDLVHRRTATAGECAAGVDLSLRHLDGRAVRVAVGAGELASVAAAGGGVHSARVPGEGMPHVGAHFVKGDLVVEMVVAAPGGGALEGEGGERGSRRALEDSSGPQSPAR